MLAAGVVEAYKVVVLRVAALEFEVVQLELVQIAVPQWVLAAVLSAVVRELEQVVLSVEHLEVIAALEQTSQKPEVVLLG